MNTNVPNIMEIKAIKMFFERISFTLCITKLIIWIWCKQNTFDSLKCHWIWRNTNAVLKSVVSIVLHFEQVGLCMRRNRFSPNDVREIISWKCREFSWFVNINTYGFSATIFFISAFISSTSYAILVWVSYAILVWKAIWWGRKA